MSIRNKGQNRWLIRVRTRIDGKMVERKSTITGNRNEAKAAEVQLQKELGETAEEKKRSLKICTFGEALTYYRENTTADLSRVETLFNRLDRELGTILLRDLTRKFGEYLNMLKTERAQRTGKLLSNVTRNRLLVYAKTALSLCVKRGLIEKNPLTGFEKLPETPRDRILSPDEELRLIETLERNNS